MLLFWILTIATLIPVFAIMLWFFLKARDVPDESETQAGPKHRLRPDTIRLLTYVLTVLVVLAAATVELFLYYG